jgi:hypothetical protein
MLSTITERSVADECRKPSIAVVPRLVKLQVKAVGRDLRQDDCYPNRIALLRTRLQIEVGLVKKEDTLLAHVMPQHWTSQLETPTAEALITVAGGQYHQAPDDILRREAARWQRTKEALALKPMELLQKQRERRSEARDWGQRAKALIADLPAGGLVVATDGGSNPEDRSKSSHIIVSHCCRGEGCSPPPCAACQLAQEGVCVRI